MADSPSPEQIRAATELLQALGSSPMPTSDNSVLDWFAAIGDFLDKGGWPILVVVLLILLRKPLQNIETFEFNREGAKFTTAKKIQNEMKSVEVEAEGTRSDKRSTEPSASELVSAGSVEALASSVDLSVIRMEAGKLAREYESTRASRPPGDERTRRMEIVMSKMRAMGLATFPIRQEFMAAPTPGFRLLAIASLQVKPDYENLDWLAERLKSEKPFVGYHAAVALLMAARHPLARDYAKALRAVAEKIEAIRSDLPKDSDRDTTLMQFLSVAGNLPQPRP